MQYRLKEGEALKGLCQTEVVICFHNPEIDGITFSSMEKYMMYQKAQIFHDSKIMKKILEEDDVAQIKAYGRQVADYEEKVWNGLRQITVYRGLVEKFSQNVCLRKRLKQTGNAVLAECAVHDKIWGIGLSMQDPARFEISKWNGQNLLGFALMKVRESL